MTRRITTLLSLVLAMSLSLAACGGCGDDNNGEDPNNGATNNGTNSGRPTAGPGQMVVVEGPEIDLASAAVNGYLPNLEDPIAPEESRALIEDFDWADTEPLPETSPDGRNSIWYVLIYLDDHDSARALRESGIYHDMLPLFGEERERWAGQVGAFRLRGDGEGIFAFAVLHGQIYNSLRELALEGNPVFRGIVLRDAPEGATQSDGSLDYEYLAARGFRGGAAIEMPPSEDEPADTVTHTQEIVWVPGMPVSILRAQVNLALDLVDEMRRAATEVAGFFGGERQFLIEVDVLNSDPAFDGTPEPLMRSAWRRGGGELDRAPQIELFGANVRLQTDLLLADAPLGRDGKVIINAFDDTAYTVCIAARNPAAEVSEFLTPIIACHFAPPDVDAMGNPVDSWGAVQTVDATTTYHRVIVKDYSLNILAQFTDAREYMRRSIGIEPRQARALTGPLADLLGDVQSFGGEGDRAFAACNGGDFIDLYGGILAALGPIGVALEPFHIALSNDVLFPGVGDVFVPGHVSAAVSRGVPTHEYGHFAMCELIRQTEPHTFVTMWTDVSLTSLGGQSVDTEQLWTVEGWADFFTFQVVGGTNYFGFESSWMGSSHTGVYYCDSQRTPPAGTDMHPACLEENVGGSGPLTVTGGAFDRLAATVSTVLHDAFDAPGRYMADSPEYDFAPDGAWTNLFAGTIRFRAGRGGASDEDVALPPEAIRGIFHHLVWAPNLLLTPTAFYDAVARTLADYGFESDDICHMFALHDPAGDCFNLISRGALDTTDSTPSTPFDLTAQLLPGNDAVFSWEDASFFATGWEWELVGGGETRTGSIPFELIPTHIERGLLPNTEYTFTVHTVNGSNRSLRDASISLTTLAEAPTITNTTGLAGAIALTWAAEDAAEYIVELELPGGEIREVGRTTGTSFEIGGLDGNQTYRVRVYAVNRTGHASAPSAWETVTTAAVTTVYVATTGNDAAAGSITTPVATLGRALELAELNTAQVIEVAAGTYDEPGPLTIDFPVTIRGVGSPSIRVQSLTAALPTGASCGAADFAARATYAAVKVTATGSLYLDGMTIHAAEALSRSACAVTIDSAGAQLSLLDSEIGVEDGATTDVACAIGVLARDATNVSITNSQVFGFNPGSQIDAPVVDAAAACIGAGSGAVQLIDSSFRPFGGTVPAGVTSLYGVIIDANTLRISRSRVYARGMRGLHGLEVGAASVAGLFAHVQNSVNVDNSVFLTPRGGTVNDALRVEAPGTPILLSLVHVTANVGDDWSDLNEVTPGHHSAAVRIVGDVDHLELTNSLLSHAGGYSPTGVVAALNLEQSGPLCDYKLRGNAMAVPAVPFGNGRGGLIVTNAAALEFGITNAPNAAGSYPGGACSAGSEASQNLAMTQPLSGADSVDKVPTLDSVGYPVSHTAGGILYTASRDALLGGGIPLNTPGLAAYAIIGTDASGTARPMSGPPSIGAYTDP